MQQSGEHTEPFIGEYTIVRLSRDNCTDLARLYKAVHGKNSSKGYFIKKYNTIHTGHAYTGLLAYNSEGVPVAFSGLQPCFIVYKDKKILAAQNIDIMTHPQHRYKGMFVELSKRLFALSHELGITLLFGFPNQHSYHGVIHKLNWKETERLSAFIVPVKPGWTALVFRKLKFLKPFYRVYRTLVLKRYKVPAMGLESSLSAGDFGAVYRSLEYLSWKTYNESFVIHAGPASVWLSDRHHLMIGDMEIVKEADFKLVMRVLKKIAVRLGIREIQFHISPASPLHTIWAGHFTPVPSYPVVFQDFGSAIPVEKIKFSFADIDIF